MAVAPNDTTIAMMDEVDGKVDSDVDGEVGSEVDNDVDGEVDDEVEFLEINWKRSQVVQPLSS